MKNYVYVFHVESAVKPSEENMAAWGKWFETLGDKLVDGGNPFNGQAEAGIRDGVVSMDADTVAGYTIVKADNLEEAVEMAKGCPVATGSNCWLRVYETMPM